MGHRFEVTAGFVDVEISDNDGGRPAVCLVHPYASMHSAADAVSTLTGRTVVCVNPRGVPPSAPLGDEKPSLEAIVDDLEEVRQTLGFERWAIWGMSGGGMVAQVYACRRPEALSAAIFDSVSVSFQMALRQPACILNPAHPAWGHLALTAAEADEDPYQWRPIGSVWAWQTRRGHTVAVSSDRPSSEMQAMMPTVWAHDASPWLADVDLPVLVIAGRDDEIVPLPAVVALRDSMPGAELLIVEGAGHVPIGSHASAMTRPVRSFLDGGC